MSTGVSAVYLHVVDSVVGKLREEFLNEGVDDAVLTELQSLWEMKMLQCGAIQGPIERNTVQKTVVPTPVRDLNVPYEGPEEYETPTAEMLFPPTPMQTPMQTPLPTDTPGHQYFSGSSDYAPTPDIGGGHFARSPYLPQPSPWANQRPLEVDVNVAYEEAREHDELSGSGSRTVNNAGSLPPAPQSSMKDFFPPNAGKRKRDNYTPHFLPDGYIPQQDGSGDVPEKYSLREKLHGQGITQSGYMQTAASHNALLIPQNDGFPDNYDEGVRRDDYSTPSYYAAPTPTVPNIGTPKPKTEVEDEEPPLNEDDDDDDDLEDLEGEEVQNTNHLVLAQFEKVNRTKSRWKCTLKDGIMHLNNKDILFTKANGEFDF